MNWLYKNVKLDSVEKSAEKDQVVEETSSASSEMARRVKNMAEYTAGLQAYTVRTLNNVVATVQQPIDENFSFFRFFRCS